MKKSTFIIFSGYIWTKVLVRLITKPYPSMREISRRPVLLPIVFSPFYALFAFFLIGRIASYFFDLQGLARSIFALILSSGLIAILLWQIILVYFLIVFFSAKMRQ